MTRNVPTADAKGSSKRPSWSSAAFRVRSSLYPSISHGFVGLSGFRGPGSRGLGLGSRIKGGLGLRVFGA